MWGVTSEAVMVMDSAMAAGAAGGGATGRGALVDDAAPSTTAARTAASAHMGCLLAASAVSSVRSVVEVRVDAHERRGRRVREDDVNGDELLRAVAV